MLHTEKSVWLELFFPENGTENQLKLYLSDTESDQLMAAQATFIALDLSTFFSYLKQSHVA